MDFSGAMQILCDHVEKWAREAEASTELLPEDVVYRYKSLEEMADRFGESQWRDSNPWADDSDNDGSDEMVELDRVVFEYRSFGGAFIFRDIVPGDQFGFKWSEFEHEKGVQVLQRGGCGGCAGEMMKYADAAHVYVEGDPVEPVIVPDHAPDDVGRWFELAKLAAVSKEMRAISSGALVQLKKLHTKLGTQRGRIDKWRYDVGALMARSIKHASIYATDADSGKVDYDNEVPLPDGDFTFAFVHQRSFEDANVWLCDLQKARSFSTRRYDMSIQYEAGNWQGYEDVLHFDYEYVEKRPDATVVYVRKLGRMLKQVKVEYWRSGDAISQADMLAMLDAAPWSAQ